MLGEERFDRGNFGGEGLVHESYSFQAAHPPSFNYLFQKLHNFIGKNQCSLTKLELYENFNLVLFLLCYLKG